MSDRLTWAKENPTACIFPFSVTDIRLVPESTGLNYSCCCNLDRATSSPALLENLKNNIKNKLPTTECHLCYDEESKGNQSERIRGILGLDGKNFDIFKRDLEISSHHQLLVKFSNLCPLACRSCNINDSTGFSKIIKKDAPIEVTQDITDDPAHWETIKSLLTDIYEKYEQPGIHLIGGETLIQPGAKKTLQWLIDNRMSHKFFVNLTTSIAVNLSDSVVDLLKQFRYVGFFLSIDSVGENYHYVRWPASFSKVEKNLEYILGLYKSNNEQIHIVLNPVFSLNNLFYINDYLDYFYRWNATHNCQFDIQNVHLFRPDILAIETLPPEYRDKLNEYLTELIRHDIFSQGSYTVLKSFFSSLTGSRFEQTDSMFIHFLKFTAEFDRRTNTKFSVYNQRFWDILSDRHKKIYSTHLESVNIKLDLHKSMYNTNNAYY